MKKRPTAIWLFAGLAIALWLTGWLIDTRYALLDDALIHLHYARFLHQVHFITFDGVHPSFGTSSLLYVTLLALLSGLSSSPLLPKVVADCTYVVLIAVLFSQVVRVRRSAVALAIFSCLLLSVLTPMAIRWLTDGMETGLTSLFVVLLVLLTDRRLASAKPVSAVSYALFVLMGMATVYLRIELALAIGFCFLMILISDLARRRSMTASILDASPLLVGAVVALLSIRAVFGYFLPDTALAKSSHASLEPLLSIVSVIGSGIGFGVSLILCWGLSLLLLVWSSRKSLDRNARLLLLTQNLPFVALMFLSCLRGQSMGIRYICWAIVFSIMANAFWLWRAELGSSAAVDSVLTRRERAMVLVYLLLFACILPIDWKFSAHVQHGREKTFLKMRALPLQELFAGKVIVAEDVGFVTYFSKGVMCDLSGLVSGRELAKKSHPERLALCSSLHPGMFFLTAGQIQAVAPYIDLQRWKACGSFDFTNVRSDDRHYMVVPEAVASKACDQLGGASTIDLQEIAPRSRNAAPEM